MLDFFQNVMHDFIAFLGLQLLSHAAERDPDDIPVMQFRSRIFIAEFEP